jgi:glycosyltransferase involved in cell wall biosynthesis
MLDLIVRLNQHQLCVLDLLGKFEPEDLKVRAENHSGWQFVEYYGEVSHAAALARIKDADIGLAILDRVADFPTSSITKLFEYMQFGVPFVASDFPAWKVSTALGSPGLYVDPKSFDDVVAEGLRLTSDRLLRARMGQAGKYYVATEFNWERISEPFLQLVAGMSAKKRGLGAQ